MELRWPYIVRAGSELCGTLRDESPATCGACPAKCFWVKTRPAFRSNGCPAGSGTCGLEFDYTIVHGPPAALCSDAALLGYLSDGVVLVLEAGKTRRATAQRTVQMLQATQCARLLGAVLSNRKFPIPDGIYRRL